MAETTPAPAPTSDDQPPAVEERRPSSERKKSTAALANPPEEIERTLSRKKSAIAASPDAERQSTATEAGGADAAPYRAAAGGTAEAAASADVKSAREGEQPPAAGEETPAVQSPDGSTRPAVGSAPSTSQDGGQASPTSAETPVPEKQEEPVNLQWDYNTPLSNIYFRPSLVDLCVPVMAKNFALYPGFGSIPADERLRVVDEIPLDLPLKLAADMIPEEPYWKRRVQVRWRNCDIVAHGRSWKQTFFERNLQEALERYDVTTEKESELVELMKISVPYVHNLDLVQLPSHFDLKLIFYVLRKGLTGLRVHYGILETPGAKFDWSKWGIKISDCRSLSAALTVTATLTTLRLTENRIDAEKMGILAKGLMANPTVVDLDLSCNLLRDEGVRQVARVLTSPNSVIGMLNLASNHITPEGCRFLAECEDVNRSLVSLNLTSNVFGDLGGKRIIDWANNNPIIQRISLECCDIGEDSVQSFTRLMHNEHSALTALNISGNRAIGVTGGETVLTGLEAGKQMKELWIVNCDCGEDLEDRILKFLVERKYGRTCIHHGWSQEDRPSLLVRTPKVEVEVKPTEEEEKEKAQKERQEKEIEEKKKKQEVEEQEEKTEEEKAKAEEERKKKEEEDAVAAAAAEAAAKKKEEEDRLKAEEDLVYHVGHGHGEECTLECSRMVGLPSKKPPPEPVVYPETWFAARDAQTAIKKIEDAKPYWGLESLKDMKEKETRGKS